VWRTAAVAVAVAALALLAPTVGLAGAHPEPTPASFGARPLASAVLTGVTVTWDGQPISSAGSPSSAFSYAKGATARVDFAYDEISGPAISNASIQVTYLGLVLTTSTSATSPAIHLCLGCGQAAINWSFGNLIDALEGAFRLTASLLYANGTTAWSESFYIFVQAPYLLESAAVVVLLVLAIVELYAGALSIREAGRGPRPPKPGPEPPSAKGTVAPGAPPAAGAPEGPAEGPPGPTTPPGSNGGA
jgi:hypothetical protein